MEDCVETRRRNLRGATSSASMTICQSRSKHLRLIERARGSLFLRCKISKILTCVPYACSMIIRGGFPIGLAILDYSGFCGLRRTRRREYSRSSQQAIRFSTSSGGKWPWQRVCRMQVMLFDTGIVMQRLTRCRTCSEKYTSHCFRRSGATFLADGGVSLENLKRFGRWKSTTCAERYVASSAAAKTGLALQISDQQKLSTQASSRSQISKKVHLEKGRDTSTEVSMTHVTGNNRGGSIFGGEVTFTNCSVVINVSSAETISKFLTQ